MKHIFPIPNVVFLMKRDIVISGNYNLQLRVGRNERLHHILVCTIAHNTRRPLLLRIRLVSSRRFAQALLTLGSPSSSPTTQAMFILLRHWTVTPCRVAILDAAKGL